MRALKLRGSVAGRCGRGVVAGMLCLAMAGQPAFSAGVGGTPGRGSGRNEIQGDARIVHALNRLTFGPRPGDVAAVKAMGLEKWFEEQMNPAGIDDSALEERLGAFPALRLPQAELMARYPSAAVIRQMARGEQAEVALPRDPVARAVYADQIAFYQMKLKADGGKGKPDGAEKSGVAIADPAMGAAEQAGGGEVLGAAPKEHVATLYPEAETLRILGMAPAARFEAVLTMEPKDLVAFRRSLSKGELAALAAGMTPEQKETLQALGGSAKVIGGEVLQARMMRDIYSERQLEAVMTDFWLNHFNVYVKKNQVEPFLLPEYERAAIRPRALGKFEDLLVATAKSPAMLVYLDNWQSVGPDSQASRRAGRLGAAAGAKAPRGLNENYARELMELHTLGVGGGYTQADVTQVAKVFTGWTVDQPYRQGTYTFEERRHEPGSKTVLGRTIREDGEREGLEVLHLLATSPATARFISTKLAVRFVSDDPPAALVDRMAGAFLSSGGDIKTVLRTMFHAPEFWAAGVERGKVKTPEEFVISAVRASGAEVKSALPLVQALEKLGMPLYGMQTPNGYSWKQDGWVSTGALVSRMNFALVLSGDKIPGVRTRWPQMLEEGTLRATPVSAGGNTADARKELRLESVLLGTPVSARTRATVLAEFNDQAMQGSAEKDFDLTPEDVPAAGGKKGGGRRGFQAGAEGIAGNAPGDAQAAGMAGLLLGSPEFQRR